MRCIVNASGILCVLHDVMLYMSFPLVEVGVDIDVDVGGVGLFGFASFQVSFRS